MQSSLLSYPETQGLEYYSMVKIHRRTSPSIIHAEYAQRWYSFRCANLCPFRGEWHHHTPGNPGGHTSSYHIRWTAIIMRIAADPQRCSTMDWSCCGIMLKLCATIIGWHDHEASHVSTSISMHLIPALLIYMEG